MLQLCFHFQLFVVVVVVVVAVVVVVVVVVDADDIFVVVVSFLVGPFFNSSVNIQEKSGTKLCQTSKHKLQNTSSRPSVLMYVCVLFTLLLINR